MTKNLTNIICELGNGLKRATLITAILCSLGLSGCKIFCPTPNRPPSEATLSAYPISGQAPLEVGVSLDGEDPDGKSDIVEYEVTAVAEDRTLIATRTNSSPIDNTLTFDEPGDYTISGTVTDYTGETLEATPIEIEVYAPEEDEEEDEEEEDEEEEEEPIIESSLSQTLERINDVDIEYNASLLNVDNATLQIKKGDEVIAEREINESDYNETLEDMIKGDYSFILTGDGLSTTDEINIPNFAPEIDLSSLDLNLNEESQLILDLSTPTDKNPEDNPVQYVSVNSLNEKTTSVLNENQLTIQGNTDETGFYQIKLEFGSTEAGTSIATLGGELYNLVDISGRLEDNETDSPQEGLVKIYDITEERILNLYDYLKNSLEEGITISSQLENGRNFSFQINNPSSEIILQARILDTNNNNLSYIREIRLSEDQDHSDLLIRAVPYTGLEENGISIEGFRSHVMEVAGPFIGRWDFEGVSEYSFRELIISKNNPYVAGSFTHDEALHIKDRILDVNDIGAFVEGKIQYDQITIEESYLYTESDGGKIIIYPDTRPVEHPTLGVVSGYASANDCNGDGYIDFAKIVIGDTPINNFVLAHECGHGLAGFGHADTLSNTQTIMVEEEIALFGPAFADIKAAKIVYEDTYAPRERLDKILVMAWLNE